MYFKFFTLGINLENDIQKAGFQVNSYEESNIYSGSRIEFTILTPKTYILKGDTWDIVDASLIGERACCLAKTPHLSFQELWSLFINSEESDDRLGALVLMNKEHRVMLLQSRKALMEIAILSNHEKRALKALNII